MKLHKTVCINLKTRPDRKKHIIHQSEKWGFDITFFNAELNTQSPIAGCWNSHSSIISTAKKNNEDYVWIIEDDTIFEDCPIDIPEPPSDWGMIYMGGTIVRTEPYSEHYEKVISVLSTHAYIMRNTLFDTIPSTFSDVPIDVWYSENIQTKYPCYILKNPISYQADGYSDIEECYTKDPRVRKDPEYSFVETAETDTGDIRLVLKDHSLPKISVIVPVRRNTPFVNVILHNYYNTQYPQELIEWILICDDYTLQDLLPDEINIHILSGNPSISEKRNYGCSVATGTIILHVDDDDFYNEFHALGRVRALLSNNIECIGCTIIPCLDTSNYSGYLRGNIWETLMEGSMAYTKKFWEQQKFDTLCARGEGLLFLKNRGYNLIKQISWIFVLDTTLSHTTNITGDSRRASCSGNKMLYNELSEDIKMILMDLS